MVQGAPRSAATASRLRRRCYASCTYSTWYTQTTYSATTYSCCRPQDSDASGTTLICPRNAAQVTGRTCLVSGMAGQPLDVHLPLHRICIEAPQFCMAGWLFFAQGLGQITWRKSASGTAYRKRLPPRSHNPTRPGGAHDYTATRRIHSDRRSHATLTKFRANG